jgi:hypothetical protein
MPAPTLAADRSMQARPISPCQLPCVGGDTAGYDYALTIIAAAATITEHGPGRPSVYAWLMPRMKGPRLAAVQMGAGIAASYLSDRIN